MKTKQQQQLQPVTVENFVRAETDLYFGSIVKKGGFGKFEHNREPTPIDEQTVVRMNRDTIYSGAVFDLDADFAVGFEAGIQAGRVGAMRREQETVQPAEITFEK